MAFQASKDSSAMKFYVFLKDFNFLPVAHYAHRSTHIEAVAVHETSWNLVFLLTELYTPICLSEDFELQSSTGTRGIHLEIDSFQVAMPYLGLSERKSIPGPVLFGEHDPLGSNLVPTVCKEGQSFTEGILGRLLV